MKTIENIELKRLLKDYEFTYIKSMDFIGLKKECIKYVKSDMLINIEVDEIVENYSHKDIDKMFSTEILTAKPYFIKRYTEVN